MSHATKDWRALCAARKQRQLDAIPKQWTIHPPPHHSAHPNVLDVPKTCGLLTARELDITDTVNVVTLLDNLRTGQWSSVEVTTAFYKRAIVAHQLVSSSHSYLCIPIQLPSNAVFLDQLLDRDLHRPGAFPRTGSRYISPNPRKAHRTFAWSPNLSQGPVLPQRHGDHHGYFIFISSCTSQSRIYPQAMQVG